MEKALKEKEIFIEETLTNIIISGETESFRSQFTNMGGKELKTGEWTFPAALKEAIVQIISEVPDHDVEGLALNPEKLSDEEILEICVKNDLSADTSDRDSCLEGADETKTYNARKKLPTLEGLEIQEEEVVIEPKKPRKPRKKKALEIDAKTRKLFDNIHESVLRDIISFTPQGVEFIFAETTDEIVFANAKALMIRQPGEDEKMWKTRAHITAKIDNSPNLDLTPDTTILLGYIISKKVLYGVRYDTYVEAAVRYVSKRV